MASTIGKPGDDSTIVEKLPDEINEMKIKDEKVFKFIFSVRLVALYHQVLIITYASSPDPQFCVFGRKWILQWWMEMELKLAVLL